MNQNGHTSFMLTADICFMYAESLYLGGLRCHISLRIQRTVSYAANMYRATNTNSLCVLTALDRLYY